MNSKGTGNRQQGTGHTGARRRAADWSRSLASGLPCALILLLALAGCAGPRVPQPMRAIWVTRGDYRSQDDVDQIIANCADAGFNTVIFQVRGNGTAWYESKLEPWAVELGGTHPGFDPLTRAIEQAREHDVQLHAWVNVMPAWRGTKPPENPDQLYNKKPEWFWYDQHGDRQALSSFYVSLNPCLPEVREYLVAVFEDLVARYPVDGLHMDYIRFPNEPPATPRGSGIDYPRDDRTLALYKQATGKAPEDDEQAWDDWRTEQVTQLVRDIDAMIARTRPTAALSASVGSVPTRALHHFQDGRRWMEEGLLDFQVLMNYTDDPAVFVERIEPWLEAETSVPLVPGLWFGRHPDKTTEEAAAVVAEQINLARAKTGNFCVFAYSSLFDSRDNELVARQSPEQRAKRAARRPIVLPAVAGSSERVEE